LKLKNPTFTTCNSSLPRDKAALASLFDEFYGLTTFTPSPDDILSSLPVELIQQVVLHLDVRTLFLFCQVSRLTRYIATHMPECRRLF
jgi:hypothetical protein